NDDVRITLTVAGILGSYGTITCQADDSKGQYGVPRAAIDAVLEDDELSSVNIAVQRERREIKKGLSTTGQLLEHTVQPEGWLELVSASVESTTLLGCDGQAYCGGECVDILYNGEHCGGCNNA